MASTARKHLVALATIALAGIACAQGTLPAAPASAAAAQPTAPDCRKLWREYRRSQACFERYRTVTGIRAEAFAACGPELPDPSAQCGPLTYPPPSRERRR